MTINYFKLQATLLKRHIKAAGIPVAMAIGLLLGTCYLIYHLLLRYPTFGGYALLLGNLQLLFVLTERNRNDFLKNIFRKKDFHKIRLLENGIVILPSMIILLLQAHWAYASTLCLLAALFAFLDIKSYGRSIRTPFTRYPFEFIIGFRRSYLLLMALYLLAAIGFYVSNSNLVLFCLACIALSCLFYYQSPEPILYVWNYRHTPTGFLLRKIKRGLLQCFVLTLPIVLPYVIIFSADLFQALIIGAGMLLLLPFYITLKYVVYPREISLPEASILVLCFSFYPLILALLPFYYVKAVKNLKNYL